MAQTKLQAPYDPVKSVVGMWNGTITRLGYFFKDPANYGEPTKAVLTSTSRRYQDALDDCEIQILEAKWYLEHQLKLNRQRREAEEAEKDSESAKRKLLDFQEVQWTGSGVTGPEGQQAKRQCLSDSVPMETTQMPVNQEICESKENLTLVVAAKKSKEIKTAQGTENAEQSTERQGHGTTTQSVPSKDSSSKLSTPAALNTSMPAGTRPSTSHGGRGPLSQSGQNTPITAAEEFNFESMFGEPSGDPNDAAGINFDNMDLPNTDQMGGNSLDPGGFADSNAFSLSNTNLNNLLPGLESYAKQSDDPGAGEGGFDFGNTGESVGNEFALPDLGTSTFDDFLNDNTFVDGGGDSGDDFLKDGEMMNLDDLDASFFDAS